MRTELPLCKRCCFCLPLRYGLLTWGYFKLIISTILAMAMLITLYNAVEVIITHKRAYYLRQIVTVGIILSITLLDIALNAVFIVGGHTKNVKFIRIYYYYNIALWVLTVLLVLLLAIILLPSLSVTLSYQTWVIVLDFSSSFINIIIQTYLVLLLRSEIVKLRNNCEFRFVNNAAEAECAMNFKEITEKEKADIYQKETEIQDGCKQSCAVTCHSKGTCSKK